MERLADFRGQGESLRLSRAVDERGPSVVELREEGVMTKVLYGKNWCGVGGRGDDITQMQVIEAVKHEQTLVNYTQLIFSSHPRHTSYYYRCKCWLNVHYIF